MNPEYGKSFRAELSDNNVIPVIGIYDVFSASIAARYYRGVFISGFGFAASYYGLPDIGLISWSDIVGFVQRVRMILPTSHLIVDIDDGYADTEVACHVTRVLETSGASAVIIEDQLRPRKCGHFDGKVLMDLESFLSKLTKVIGSKKDMLVIARTDSNDIDDIQKRVVAFCEAGADGILVDAIHNLEMIRSIKSCVNRPVVVNQIAGGKTPHWTISEMKEAGADIILYSTPCLFAVQRALNDAMEVLVDSQGLLRTDRKNVSLRECDTLLRENLEWRNSH